MTTPMLTGSTPQMHSKQPQDVIGSWNRAVSYTHLDVYKRQMYCLLNEGLHRSEAYATAVVLLVMVIGINALSGAAAKRIARRTQ